jgi:alpha-D-ribose 1-methylphosphonate 5-triphosphate synthase subunit PhnL
MPPSDGIPLQNRSYWSRKCPRVPRERSPSLGHVSDVPRVIPRSLCFEAAVEPFGGPAFEPLISSGRSPSGLRRLSNPSEGPAFEPLTSSGREARVL